MKKIMKKSVLLAGSALIVPVAAAAAGGIQGACVDCHTMHNSYQGESVTGGDPIQNLLKYDCVGCHAQGGNSKILDMGGGTAVPQVLHNDPTGDLAAGNFAYISGLKLSDQPTNPLNTGALHRKGHNVVDLLNPDNTLGAFGYPPGTYDPLKHEVLYDNLTFVQSLTCAGAGGCHGTRNQALSATQSTVPSDETYTNIKLRKGIAAISGSHHLNTDGAKTPASTTLNAGVHSGKDVADSYRFILGLKGYEVEDSTTTTSSERWQNIQGGSHNEYYGNKSALPNTNTGSVTTCNVCHVEGAPKLTPYEFLSMESKIAVPNQTMSGFCATCHGAFHSVGSAGNTLGQNNGVSGAFLRHPSDYVLPGGGTEYAGYVYDITAPVARSGDVPSTSTNGRLTDDMVMCLSCHMAHASPYDSMLRFDYSAQTKAMSAGAYADSTAAKAKGGCLACHTWKGVLPGTGRL